MNRENLETLAAYLEKLPLDYRHFQMSDFVVSDDDEALKDYAFHNGGVARCGTAACALGHGPAAGIFFPNDPQFIEDEGGIWGLTLNWGKYSREFFISSSEQPSEWEWCFGGGWRDNTPHGAAARIRYMLAGCPIPQGAWDTYSDSRMPFESGGPDNCQPLYEGFLTDAAYERKMENV